MCMFYKSKAYSIVCLFCFSSNRKGNLIILYDWTIKMKIKGSSEKGKDSEGTINVANFCDENEINDIEVRIIVIVMLKS